MSKLPARRPRAELATLPELPRVGMLDLFDALIADAKCPNTAAARRWDMIVFAEFLGTATPAEACATFVGRGRPDANAIGLAYRKWMQDRGYAPATCNRRLATLRRVSAWTNARPGRVPG